MAEKSGHIYSGRMKTRSAAFASGAVTYRKEKLAYRQYRDVMTWSG